MPPYRALHRAATLLLGSFVAAALPAADARSESTATAGTAHAALWPPAHSRGLVSPAGEQEIDALLSRLSLEEKIGQMIQADMSTIRPADLREIPVGSVLAGGDSPSLGSPTLRTPVGAWVDTARAFRAVSVEERPGHTPIPVMLGIDAVHGNSHVPGATVFPHNIGLGAAHDPELVQRIAAATAQETAASGFDWAFGPTLAVPQDVRWGRSYEGYADDPALVTQYAGAFVQGMQGDPEDVYAAPAGLLQGGHVATSAKHFLGDGATREGVDQGDAQISEAELMRVHAAGYRAAIDAGALTVMVSFSSWQGVKMSGNRSLLTDVLKGRMGFEGFVVSDWNSHGQIPGCSNVDCPAAINAGIDMLMAPDGWKELYGNLLAQARAGTIPASRIDDAVRRILRVKRRLGLFAAQRPWEGRDGVLSSPEHRALARESVRKSLVLLKNKGGVLPLRATSHVLVTGSAADAIGTQCGGWTLSWQGNDNHNADFPRGTSVYAGLAAALQAGGGSAELQPDAHFTIRPDVAVVVFGETPYAEGWGDLKNLEYQAGDKHDLGLLRTLETQGIPVVLDLLVGTSVVGQSGNQRIRRVRRGLVARHRGRGYCRCHRGRHAGPAAQRFFRSSFFCMACHGGPRRTGGAGCRPAVRRRLWPALRGCGRRPAPGGNLRRERGRVQFRELSCARPHACALGLAIGASKPGPSGGHPPRRRRRRPAGGRAGTALVRPGCRWYCAGGAGVRHAHAQQR